MVIVLNFPKTATNDKQKDIKVEIYLFMANNNTQPKIYTLFLTGVSLILNFKTC